MAISFAQGLSLETSPHRQEKLNAELDFGQTVEAGGFPQKNLAVAQKTTTKMDPW